MRSVVLAGAVLLLSGVTILAQEHQAQGTSVDAVQWGAAPPSLPKGAQAAVLSGDPGKPGPFTIRLKLPSGYKIPAHQHPTAEAVTVLSGEFNFGMGDKLDEGHPGLEPETVQGFRFVQWLAGRSLLEGGALISDALITVAARTVSP